MELKIGEKTYAVDSIEFEPIKIDVELVKEWAEAQAELKRWRERSVLSFSIPSEFLENQS